MCVGEINSEMKYRSVFAPLKLVALLLCLVVFNTEKIIAQVVINEVVASNSQGILDEDGDSPDWIELFNPTDVTINLQGYGISDDSLDLFKYILPSIELEPQEYFLIFASDKNRGEDSDLKTLAWETVIREGDATKYIIPSSAVSSLWIQDNFNDSGWQNGTFGIGYGDNDDNTVVPNGTGSVFTRTTFTIDDISVVDSLILHIDFDDGYVAYINGVEISRFNMEGASPISYSSFATDFITDPWLVRGDPLPQIPIPNSRDFLVEGENLLSIQVHNSGTNSSDLSLIPFLSIGTSEVPINSRGLSSQISLEPTRFSYPHTNFKLSSSGETVYLTNTDSVIVNELTYPFLNQDESFGRTTSDLSELRIFTSPTPLTPNFSEGFSERLDEPNMNFGSGIFPSSIELEVDGGPSADVIYFTTDGSDPTSSSEVYGAGARSISSTTTFKFRAIETGKLSSNVVTHTYFIGDDHELPVFSISTHPDNLWSNDRGIYVRGTNGIDGNGSNGPANWNQDWEIPVYIEYFELDNSLAFESGAGAKIYGAWSRSINPMKSLALYFRSVYGNSELNYKLFESKDIDTFQSIVLRNSGNDFSNSHFRDGLMTAMMLETEVDAQAFKPTVVYLNGEYFGIHNMREKVNEHFLASNNEGVDPDNLDILEAGSGVVQGSNDSYLAFLDLLGSTDMNDPEAYAIIESMVDIDNLIDYHAAQIYYANTDWPGNNIKYWRSRSEDGKWRWILYDTDFGFGFIGDRNHNTLDFALEEFGPGWPNPPWATFLLRRFMDNDEFVDKFANRMADLMNTKFDNEYVNDLIDNFSGQIESEMPRHFDRWQEFGGSVNSWNNQIEVLKDFADNRRSSVESHMMNAFGFSNPAQIRVNVSNTDHGIIQVNRIVPDSYPWSGRYFSNMPIGLTAIPKRGYIFTGWSGSSGSSANSIEGMATLGASYTANFEAANGAATDVVINEIMYNSSAEFVSGDWIELYNSASYNVDISGWVIKDEDDEHAFVIEDGTVMESATYLVVASDLTSFNTVYDIDAPLFGDLGYNLSGNSDQVRLYDATGLVVDSLQYDDESPWDETADGNGFSLELMNSVSDNSIATNWKAGTQIGGTPGVANSVGVSNEIREEIPSSITLSQNYPNPFNPSTSITFELPVQSRVRLTVFDMLGRKVSELADEVRVAGSHSVAWDASQFSSGVYLYRLEVGKEVFTKKMLLIK